MTKATPEEAKLMQLAENIQREDLSLTEECDVVCDLYKILGSVKEVAAVVKKSVPWCSKRYAMKNGEGLNWRARNILEEGFSEDIELLKALSSLFDLSNYDEIQHWDSLVRTKEAGRKEIREALKNKKAEIKAQEALDKNKPVSHAKPKSTEPPPPPEWNIEDALEEIQQALMDERRDKDAVDVYVEWTEAQKTIFCDLLDKRAIEGESKDGFSKIAKIQLEGSWESEVNDVELLAMIWGLRGNKINYSEIHGFFSHLQQPRELEK